MEDAVGSIWFIGKADNDDGGDDDDDKVLGKLNDGGGDDGDE